MRKFITLLVAGLFIAGLTVISNQNAFSAWGKKDKEEEKEKAKETKQEEPKLIYTFKDKEEMQTFEQLYVSKQATYGRMGVLQAYFAMEQNNLIEIDKQMQEKFGFKMDPNKMYDLNRDMMELREVGPVAPAATPAPAEATAK